MTSRVYFIILALLALAACNTAPAPDAEPSSNSASYDTAKLEEAAALITADNILEITKILSDDNMEGRAAGTAGERKAADFIADRFSSYGLKPMGQNTDFFQAVNLVGMQKDPARTSLEIAGPNGAFVLANGENITYWSTSLKEEVVLDEVELLFVGYGVEAPEHDWDDFKGVDTAGKVLVFLNNDPQTGKADEFGGEARTYYGRWTYKFEKAMEKGAAGALMIHTDFSAGYGWSVIGNSGESEGLALDMPNSGYQLDVIAWIASSLAEQMAGTVGSTLDQWFEAANKRDFQPITLPVKLTANMGINIRKTTSRNVIGVLEGSDPALKDEYIVFSAHYDHIGAHEGEGDTNFNGAWDNAVGTAAIMEIAHAFSKAESRPRRSIAFFACGAEEKGLLGSQWFVAKPPVPLKQIVANINVDMPQILGMTRDIMAIGHDTNTLGDELRDIAQSMMVDGAPVKIVGDLDPNAGLFYRSDQVNFAKAGVPALYPNPGNDYLTPPAMDPREYHSKYYHQAEDEINEAWDLSGCTRDMQALFRLAARVANADGTPKWNPGNEFESAYNKLHGQ